MSIDIQYKPIEYYTKFAEKLIKSKYGGQFYIDDEFISYVAERMMKAEYKYEFTLVSDKSKQEKTAEKCKIDFIRMHGIYGIRAYIQYRKKMKDKHKDRPSVLLSTDLHNDKENRVNYFDTLCENKRYEKNSDEKQQFFRILLNSSNLTNTQKNIVIKRILEDKSFHSIAKELNPEITYQAVHSSYKKALEKIKAMIKNV